MTSRPFVIRPSYCYINYLTPEQAKAALTLNKHTIQGSEIVVKLKEGKQRHDPPPPEWEPQDDKNVVLKVVFDKSSEWCMVEQLLHESMPDAEIMFLDRIQNICLWEQYSFCRSRMDKKNDGEVNEKLLFHGTGVTKPSKIYTSEQGFDFRYSAQGLWGTGTYFAEKARYSHHYSFRCFDNVRQILLARVLTGETYLVVT